MDMLSSKGIIIKKAAGFLTDSPSADMTRLAHYTKSTANRSNFIFGMAKCMVHIMCIMFLGLPIRPLLPFCLSMAGPSLFCLTHIIYICIMYNNIPFPQICQPLC